MASILLNRAKPIAKVSNDPIFVIYGDEGTGKTVLASTFPKTEQKPMLYLDILEGGTGSIPAAERDHIQVVPIESFEDIDSVFTDVLNGYAIDEKTGAQVDVAYSTLVIDSATQLEYLMKQYLMNSAGKSKMNLQLWGEAGNTHDSIWNACKAMTKKCKGMNIVIICHQKEEKNEENPDFAKLIPSLMTKAAHALCAKASYVWYTKLVNEQVIDPKTNEVKNVVKFATIIDADSYLLTKCRKPPEKKIPHEVNNLTYKSFKANILDKLI